MRDKEIIKSVQYLRGVAALMVVCFHFRYYLNDNYAQKDLGDALFGSGAFGVDLFFIISGFIICYSTRKPDSPHPVAAYTLKRFFRIYPLLTFSLLTFFLLFGADGYSVLKSLIPLQADYSDQGPFFGYNLLSPAWTLTYEISFYLLFLVGLAISQKHRRLIAAGLIVSIFLLLQWALNHEVRLSAYTEYDYPYGGPIRPVLAILSSPMILEFVCGIALYSMFMATPDLPEKTRVFLKPLLLGTAAVSSLIYFSGDFYGHGLTQWGAPSVALILSLLLYERLNGLPDIRWLSFLGDISYALYLTHIIVLQAIRTYGVRFGLEGAPAFAFAVSLSLVAATLVHYLVEVRAIDACRALLKHVGEAPRHAPRLILDYQKP